MAVLRNLVLGNVHAAHDLQAGNNGILQVGRHRQDFSQQPVDAHAHHHLAFLRLQMDVAGPLGKSPLNEGVDKPDGGGGFFGIGGVLRHLGGNNIRRAAGLPLHLLDDPGRSLAAIEGGNRLFGSLAGGNHGHYALARSGFHLVLRHKVQWVAHGQIQAVAHQLHRHHAVFFRNAAGHIFRQLHRDGNSCKIHKIHAKLHLQRIDKLLLSDKLILNQNIAQSLAAILLHLQGLLQLLRRDDAGGHQQVAQTHIGHLFLTSMKNYYLRA